MWHPHFKTKRLGEGNFEIIDLKIKDLMVLWKIFENDSKDKSFSKGFYSKTNIEEIVKSESKKLKCQCNFVKIMIKETDSNTRDKSLNLVQNIFNPASNEKNHLRSLLLQRNKDLNNNGYLFNNNEKFAPGQMLDKSSDIINQNINQQFKFGNNYRMKQIPNEKLKNPKLYNSDLSFSTFPNSMNEASTTNGILKTNLRRKDPKNIPYLNSFLSPQSQEIKITPDTESQSLITNEINQMNSKNSNKEITKNSENFNFSNILYYLQLNSIMMKNLENLLLSESNKNFENNLSLEQSLTNNKRENSGTTQFFKNFSNDINQNNIERNFITNLEDKKSKNFGSQFEKKIFEETTNLDQDRNILSESTSDAEVSNDLMKIVKNLNLNLTPPSAYFDFNNFPKLDFSKYNELLK